MFDTLAEFFQPYAKESLLVAVVLWFLYDNRNYLALRLKSLSFLQKNSGPSQVSVSAVEETINESLLSANQRQQAFYYLERLREYATGLKATDALKTLDILQANLFNIANQKQ